MKETNDSTEDQDEALKNLFTLATILNKKWIKELLVILRENSDLRTDLLQLFWESTKVQIWLTDSLHPKLSEMVKHFKIGVSVKKLPFSKNK